MYMKDDIDIFNQMSDIATNVSHLVDLSVPFRVVSGPDTAVVME